MIPFNKPYLSGNELIYIRDAIDSGKISGNGMYTKKCHAYFSRRYNFEKCLLTTSCTDALEMASILLNIQPGDEVISPSFTFVSTANAFVLRGAKMVFVDSMANHPNMDADLIEDLITERTKAIIVVHYAGVACDMDKITDIAKRHALFVIEDAAQAIDSYYIHKNGKRSPLGSIGHLSAFSFHETKNIISGEGGLLVVNDSKFKERADIIWEKGTNRAAFFRGEVDKYGWVDVGSSFLPSDIISAFLFAQLENLEVIQNKRMAIWELYHELLEPLKQKGLIELSQIPSYATNNAHLFYILCKDENDRSRLIEVLRESGIHAVFHYISLHKSSFYSDKNGGKELKNADRFSDVLLRLPLYYELSQKEVEYICSIILKYYTYI
jgi:dTDP-4-amino-4,6-dideoxygalactose transaminase